MKAYTSLEQSKKLAGFLPFESADMYYHKDRYGEFVNIPHFNEEYKTLVDRDIVYNKDIIPCWSLSALLGVLPTTIGIFFEKNALRLRMDKDNNDFNIWYENFDCGDVAEGLDVREDNPIDACYEMIIKLHEQKLL